MQENFSPSYMFVDLNLEAVALCEQGANSRANILLTKSVKEEPSHMDINEILASMQPEAKAELEKHIQAEIAKATKPLSDSISTLETEKSTLSTKIAELEKTAKQPSSEEELMKSMPKEVQDRFEAMQKSIKALEEAKEEALAKSRFEVVKALPVEEATLKSVLKTATPEVFDILTKAAAAVEGTLGKSTGCTGEGTTPSSADDAYDALEKHAAEIAKSENLTPAVAFTKACEKYPELYSQYVKGDK